MKYYKSKKQLLSNKIFLFPHIWLVMTNYCFVFQWLKYFNKNVRRSHLKLKQLVNILNFMPIGWSKKKNNYIYIYIYIYKQTHTHTHIYVCVCVCVCVCIYIYIYMSGDSYVYFIYLLCIYVCMCACIYMYIIIIIIILSCHQYRYPWPYLAITPYRSSLLAGPQGYTLYPHRAVVCRFKLVTLLLLSHVKGVHRSTSLMSSSLLLQQCPACLVRLTWIVFVMGDRWLYSCCFVGCCLLD